ncbi:uncharacterized protein LOC141908969 [Tubulanus polymorphus]|uniref:uncharacterized protein LOC141908969 n=1 Tax=Tubulanus polymorphus TaxID=672921 RepID=UPI003DA4423D
MTMYKDFFTGLVLAFTAVVMLPSPTSGSDVDFAVETCQEIHCNGRLRNWAVPINSKKMCMAGCVSYVYCTAILLSDDAIATECLGSNPTEPFAFLDSTKTFSCLRKCLTPKRVALMGFPKIPMTDNSITPRDYFGKIFDGDLEVILG